MYVDIIYIYIYTSIYLSISLSLSLYIYIYIYAFSHRPPKGEAKRGIQKHMFNNDSDANCQRFHAWIRLSGQPSGERRRFSSGGRTWRSCSRPRTLGSRLSRDEMRCNGVSTRRDLAWSGIVRCGTTIAAHRKPLWYMSYNVMTCNNALCCMYWSV